MENHTTKEFKKWEYTYFNKPLIDLSKYLTTNDEKILKKLDIILEDKIYTEYDFECLEMELIAFYNGKERLKEMGIEYNEMERLWNICDIIRADYSI